ncbi:MAG: hypothetical protein NTW04_02140 [Elusimicrobia bacterium]|nr:hypothetical protein [Elusimicrobiota bacterium]
MKGTGFFCFVVIMFAGVFANAQVGSKYKTNFYGYVQTDMVYDTQKNNGLGFGNEAIVYTDAIGPHERDFRIAAKETRFGVDISADEKVSAKIEMDFYGDNKVSSVTPRMRHAYIAINLLNNLEVLAGQYWQLTPLEFPLTLNAATLGASGCLWNRIPQVRFTYTFNDSFKVAAAAVRTNATAVDSNGTASGQPSVQANIVYKSKPVNLTLTGGYGEWEDADATSLTYTQRARMELIALGLSVPVYKFTLNGQLWAGQNLSDFFGGVYNPVQYGRNALKAKGGFANLRFDATKKLFFNAAYGQDDPDDKKLFATDTAPKRSKNETYLANINYMLYEKVRLSFEILQNYTTYKYPDHNNKVGDVRYQSSMRFNF